MKIFLLFHLLIISVICSPKTAPTKGQDADAAWLSYKIYEGVDKLNTDSGSVFHSHDSQENGAYALWKQKNTGECYVVIRGTKTLNDIFTDIAVEEYTDNDIEVKVHMGVRKRAKFMLDDINEK